VSIIAKMKKHSTKRIYGLTIFLLTFLAICLSIASCSRSRDDGIGINQEPCSPPKCNIETRQVRDVDRCPDYAAPFSNNKKWIAKHNGKANKGALRFTLAIYVKHHDYLETSPEELFRENTYVWAVGEEKYIICKYIPRNDTPGQIDEYRVVEVDGCFYSECKPGTQDEPLPSKPREEAKKSCVDLCTDDDLECRKTRDTDLRPNLVNWPAILPELNKFVRSFDNRSLPLTLDAAPWTQLARTAGYQCGDIDVNIDERNRLTAIGDECVFEIDRNVVVETPTYARGTRGFVPSTTFTGPHTDLNFDDYPFRPTITLYSSSAPPTIETVSKFSLVQTYRNTRMIVSETENLCYAFEWSPDPPEPLPQTPQP
jgi:hypothetical protein